MSDRSTSKQFEIEQESAFPSLSITLQEARRSYDTEQSRKGNLEAKIGATIGIDAFIISIVGVFGRVQLFTRLAIVIPALLAVGFGLRALSTRKYLKPGPPVDELFAYARQDNANAQKQFIHNYRQAVKHNFHVNNDRTDTLQTCFWLTIVSFLVLSLSPVVNAILTDTILSSI